MTQKMASDAKPQARSTISKAMRRISSIVRHSIDAGSLRITLLNVSPSLNALNLRHAVYRPILRKLPTAGSVNSAVPASQIQSDASFESDAPVTRS